MLNFGAFIRGTSDMPSVSTTPPELDDVYLTPHELSVRWRIEVSTLANQRAKGEGIPYTKPTGTVLYKLADVLEAERDAQRGFSWDRLADGLSSFEGLSAKDRSELLRHLKRAMK